VLNKNLKERIEILEKENKEKNENKAVYPFVLLKGEKLICVIFASDDQNIHYPIVCKNTDLFSKVEELLYKQFDEYKDTDNEFFVSGERINKNLTLEKNNIKYGSTILLKKK